MQRTSQEYYHARWPDGGALVTHVQDYLEGTRSIPVSRTRMKGTKSLYFTFVTDLCRMFLDEDSRIWKPYACAMQYGWGGSSRGGRSGIFVQRAQGVHLAAATGRLAQKHASEIAQDLICAPADVHSLRCVKIVYSDPSGERVVGVMKGNRIIFLGFARY